MVRNWRIEEQDIASRIEKDQKPKDEWLRDANGEPLGEAERWKAPVIYISDCMYHRIRCKKNVPMSWRISSWADLSSLSTYCLLAKGFTACRHVKYLVALLLKLHLLLLLYLEYLSLGQQWYRSRAVVSDLVLAQSCVYISEKKRSKKQWTVFDEAGRVDKKLALAYKSGDCELYSGRLLGKTRR